MAKRSEIISGTEMMTEGNGSHTKHSEVSNHSVHNYSVKQTELTAIHDAMFSALDERERVSLGFLENRFLLL